MPGAIDSALSRSPEDIQERLSAIWRDLFGESDMRIREDDDFFALGASSLLAMRMAVAASEEFQVAVGIVAVAENPTLSGLAGHIAGLAGARGERDEGEL
ncbi:phosphopantetheine-binding protein [Streptomyces sp. NPDC012421]|uniref:phosphopantetheine-binding protein n=1 Tax=Streptomyces sp. NPDC012421 TaxID=3364832 RepID=UPI0036EA9142